jgi:hypothetical protein
MRLSTFSALRRDLEQLVQLLVKFFALEIFRAIHGDTWSRRQHTGTVAGS